MFYLRKDNNEPKIAYPSVAFAVLFVHRKDKALSETQHIACILIHHDYLVRMID